MVDRLRASFSEFWQSYGSAIVTIAGVALTMWINLHDLQRGQEDGRRVAESIIKSTERLADKVNAISSSLALEVQRSGREDQFHSTSSADLAERVRALELKVASLKP